MSDLSMGLRAQWPHCGGFHITLWISVPTCGPCSLNHAIAPWILVIDKPKCLDIWLALLVISGFGKVRKKRYVDDTCKLQVIDARRKEHNQRQGWERIGARSEERRVGKECR